MSNAENIAEVLEEHRVPENGTRCTCLATGLGIWSKVCAHQAEMVSAALEPAIREREKKAWDQGWDAWNADTLNPNNPYDTKEEA